MDIAAAILLVGLQTTPQNHYAMRCDEQIARQLPEGATYKRHMAAYYINRNPQSVNHMVMVEFEMEWRGQKYYYTAACTYRGDDDLSVPAREWNTEIFD